MTVANILNRKGREVMRVGADVSLSDAARALAAKRIGALVVCGAEGEVLGILSERDIVRAVAASGPSALDLPVEAHMTSRVVTCGEAATVDECMESMSDGRFRHLPVVEDGRLVGIVSIGDIVKEKIARTVQEAEAMRVYITTG